MRTALAILARAWSSHFEKIGQPLMRMTFSTSVNAVASITVESRCLRMVILAICSSSAARRRRLKCHGEELFGTYRKSFTSSVKTSDKSVNDCGQKHTNQWSTTIEGYAQDQPARSVWNRRSSDSSSASTPSSCRYVSRSVSISNDPSCT
eukprot:SAG11_NODE_174_length_13505_cov_9.126585_8_plen_150_part_00